MTEAKPRTFKFITEDPDNYRVYYRRNETGSLFCFQADPDRPAFYLCSRDGEPECEAMEPPPEAFDRHVLPLVRAK